MTHRPLPTARELRLEIRDVLQGSHWAGDACWCGAPGRHEATALVLVAPPWDASRDDEPSFPAVGSVVSEAPLFDVEPETVMVWDADAEAPRAVARQEAGAGMLRYARRLRPGSAERGEIERQALAMLPPPGRRQRKARAK